MIQRKRVSSGRTGRGRKREESNSPVRRRGSDDVRAPPEFRPYDYDALSAFMMKSLKGQSYPFLSNGFIHLVHEIEAMAAANNFTKDYMEGEIQFINEGYYPTPNLNARAMPSYDSRGDDQQSDMEGSSEPRTARAPAIPTEEDLAKEAEICLLPEEHEEDDFDEYPAYHVGTRFWTWCRKSFMGKVDSEFLENFKETILDVYSDEALQKYLVNEPWKYRKRAAHASRRKSLNTSGSKKKVSISNEVTSPTTNGSRNGTRKTSLAGYRIPNRRISEKEKDIANNNKIMPIIDSMVYTACKEYKDSKNAPETPSGRRGRHRLTSPEVSRERKYPKLEIDTESEGEDETVNGTSSQRGSSRLHSPRQLKKEKMEEEYERMENGHSSSNGINGHSRTNGHAGTSSPKRKNGDIRHYFSSSSKPSTSTTRRNGENGYDDIEVPSDIEDFDKKAIGSKIVSKLIAGGILPDSSAQIFDELTRDDGEEGPSVSTRIEMSEEGKDDAEDQEVGELAEELHNLQMNLKEEMKEKRELFMTTWRRAKAHFAFFHTFNELKRGDYDLFKLGINMYRDFPNRKLPGISEMMLLKQALRKRNRLARIHYGKMYRRHPKYRWHQGYVPAGRRVVV
ncbi:hypothetical protein GCK72_014759 [Caenorhabditis remanei]|uniref:Uncharacterized protein n=1 Tax=Caenorhabditis remanei TaxID=31234 RepID=A0A6A5GUN1_CAERE|nr:hypothetical protein GCK72_014759 [Caenorhabditis remanei]KAF1758301.1 hypothetical protein GCK72_014759 [Caenorhabditis remanei]